MRKRLFTTILALAVLATTIGTASAVHVVEIKGDKHANVDMEEAPDPWGDADIYADYIVDNTDLEDCRSEASIEREIKAHVIGYRLGQTDKLAGITCEVNYGPY